MRNAAVSSVVLALAFATGCSDASGDLSMRVRWAFESGTCASNGVERVRVQWSRDGGMATTMELPCADGEGVVGRYDPSGGTYVISAVGLDASGTELFRNGTTLMISRGAPRTPLEIVLRPENGQLVVTWNGCPPGVILPFFITVSRVGDADAGSSSRPVTNQQTCSERTTTFARLQPGTYSVELDSRAVTPMVRGTQTATVMSGRSATVMFNLP